MNSCACNPPGSMSAAAGTTALRVTTSGASTPNMAFSASAASVTGRGAQQEGLAFPQAQQARDLIDLGAGEQHRFDRASARATARMQRLRLPNLLGKIGEALINTQFSPSAVTARLAWVRGRTRASPAHAKRHVGQRQFHCGKPPPAAEPRTRAVSRPIQDRRKCGIRTRPASTR